MTIESPLSSEVPNNEFLRVNDVADRDLEFLTDLRDRESGGALARNAHETQAVRRLYVRMFITVVESAIATFKQEALSHGKQLSDSERSLLREVTYDIDSKGEPTERALHAPFLSSLRFAFKMLVSVRGLAFKPDYSSSGWQAMQDAVRVRNRLTHPKDTTDMTVSDAEMQKVDAAELWFRQTHIALLEEYGAQLAQQLGAFGKSADA